MVVADEGTIRARYEAAGQGHVFNHYDSLSSDEKIQLLEQLDSIQVEKLDTLLKTALEDQKKTNDSNNIVPFSKKVARSNVDLELMKTSHTIGMEAIAKGHVGALVLAGGQGTRLGYDGPKGMYNIGLPSNASLFELICRRILKLRQLAKKDDEDSLPSLPFYIMTSPINHQQTIDFFKKNENFGLDDVYFFEQGMLPCMEISNNDGDKNKIILEKPYQIAMAPDGNGGIYSSLVKSGTLSQMKEAHGIKYLHVFSIDNSLIKPADPTFMGYCISENADCGNKVCWKKSSNEKVGVLAEMKGDDDDGSDDHGKPCIVEYSDISIEMAERTDEHTGRLVFGAANICNHFYTIDFLIERIVPNMSSLYHVANKKIPYWDDETKQTVKPTTANNGIKLESFIFDVFPLSKNMAVLGVNRAEEFAPVKNAPGSKLDSPDTARIMLSKMFQTWVTNAGGILTGNVDDNCICEISPSTSYAGEGIEELVKGKEIECPFQL